MINMDEYYSKIIDIKTENKIKHVIKLNMYVMFCYTIILFIAMAVTIFGMIQMFKKDGSIFYFIGLAGIVMNVVILLYVDSKDPLKGYDVNDKIYVYMRFLRNATLNASVGKKISLKHLLEIDSLTKRINFQLHIIENNIRNSFIFQPIDYNEKINLIGNINNLLRKKTIYLIEEKKTKELISLIDYIISLYEFIVFNELINDDECRKLINDRESKIKELENLIDELEKVEIDNEDNSILYKVLRFMRNPYFLGGIIALSGMMLYYFKDEYAELFQFVVFFGVIITFICAVFQFSPKNNKIN